MSRIDNQIPIYAADGTPRGYRTREAAQRLLLAGFVTAVHGRKGHWKAIFMRQEDGSSPVKPDLKVGTRYSYQQHLDSGYVVWALKRYKRRSENRPVNAA